MKDVKIEVYDEPVETCEDTITIETGPQVDDQVLGDGVSFYHEDIDNEDFGYRIVLLTWEQIEETINGKY
jgi:hypothetical protein